MKSKLFAMVVLVVLAFVLAACGGSTPTTAPAAQTEAPAAATEAPDSLPFPTGKFVRSDRVNPVGFIFNADGTWEAREFTYGKTEAKGTYSVEGNIFTETSNNGGCDTNVQFNYTFDGSNLTFTYVGNPEDDAACGGRQAGFNNVTYILSEE